MHYELFCSIGGDFISDFIGWLAAVITLSSVIIEIVPVKWCPITSFIRWFGKIVNKDISAKLDEQIGRLDIIETKINGLERDIDIHDIKDIRYKILFFADAVKNGNHYSQKSYEHILELNDEYERLLSVRHVQNGVVEEAVRVIIEHYRNEFCK